MRKRKAEKHLWLVLTMIMPFVWGLFYEFSVFICACLLLIGISIRVKKNGKMVFFNTYISTSMILFTMGYWLSIIFAIEKGIAFIGALKFTTPLLLLLFLMQVEKEERERCIQMIPTVGSVMLGISIFASFFKVSRGYFFQAGRLGGFFQYSNTMALFLLIGIILLCFKKKKSKKTWIEIVFLTVGILLTGSRSVFFMLLVFFALLCMKERHMRKWLVLLVGGIFITTSFYVWVTGDYQNIGRYFSTSPEASTLLGRILYNIDGLHLLSGHLGGVGYKGYFILQPMMQTGRYTTMFVHNDWLQIALDAGIITSIALTVAVLGSVVSKDNGLRNKIVLIAIAIHMLVDFDLQYFTIFAILVFMFPLEKNRREVVVAKGTALLLPVVLLYGYLAVAYFLYHVGLYDTANKLYPHDTKIKEVCMLNSSTMESAEHMANEILESNSYSYAAWNIKAIAELEKGNYKEMIRCKKKGLSITKYNILEYQDYIVLLKKAIDGTTGKEQASYIEDLLFVEDQVQDVLEQTNELAYRIKDKPELEMEEAYIEYIQIYKDIRNEKEE